MALSPELTGFIALAVLFAAIFIGFPIVFTVIAVALAFGYFALDTVVLHLMVLQVFAVMRDPTFRRLPPQNTPADAPVNRPGRQPLQPRSSAKPSWNRPSSAIEFVGRPRTNTPTCMMSRKDSSSGASVRSNWGKPSPNCTPNFIAGDFTQP